MLDATTGDADEELDFLVGAPAPPRKENSTLRRGHLGPRAPL
jgi:hypothetical protein